MRRSREGYAKGMRARFGSVGKRCSDTVWVRGGLIGGGKENLNPNMEDVARGAGMKTFHLDALKSVYATRSNDIYAK